MIRVLEVDMRQPPRMQSLPTLPRRIMQAYGESGRLPAGAANLSQLESMGPAQLLALLFDLKARDLYGEIEVLSEPYALNLFRQRVHDAWLLGNCATSRCHGGLEGGRFFLHRRNHRDERVRFTNLLILLRSGWSEQPLVDFDRPADSLILQHALPRSEARFPHPDVPGWRPVFTNANQRLLADALRWIEQMHRPRPAYPVDYEPPELPGRPLAEGESDGSSGSAESGPDR